MYLNVFDSRITVRGFPRNNEDRECGQGGVCDHTSHLGYHIKGKLLWKAKGAILLNRHNSPSAHTYSVCAN